jgi:Asp-tRNA(Asn)/Glu-tRNA(Gln) amidotransferase A subunit family amidase
MTCEYGSWSGRWSSAPAPTEPATSARGGHAFTDYTQFLDADALDGARIGVWREGTYDPDVSPEVDVIMEATIEALISLAYDFEQATDVRVPPRFLASTSADAATGNAADREDRTVAPGRHGRWAMPSLR